MPSKERGCTAQPPSETIIQPGKNSRKPQIVPGVSGAELNCLTIDISYQAGAWQETSVSPMSLRDGFPAWSPSVLGLQSRNETAAGVARSPAEETVWRNLLSSVVPSALAHHVTQASSHVTQAQCSRPRPLPATRAASGRGGKRKCGRVFGAGSGGSRGRWGSERVWAAARSDMETVQLRNPPRR